MSSAWRGRAWLVVAVLFLFGCSGSAAHDSTSPSDQDLAGQTGAAPETDATDQSVAGSCERGADRIAERLEQFFDELPDIGPDEFLELEGIDGLPGFQNDVAAILSETTNQSSTLCDLDGMQTLLDERLRDVETDGLLEQFLLSTITDGRELTTADLRVSPGDDVEAVLGLLDDGSTLTFDAGTYLLDRPLLVQRSVTLIGAGADSTTLESTASDAALVVVGRGELAVRDLTLEHQGNVPASVLLAFGRPVELVDTRLAGGSSDADGGAGNGLVLTDETFGGTEAQPAVMDRSVVSASVVSDNEGAGIAVNGAVSVVVADSTVRSSGVCGVCFFGSASGEVTASTIDANEVGIQIADDSTPTISQSVIIDSGTAGIVAVGRSESALVGNTIERAADVGIAVQDSAGARISENGIGDLSFAVSILSDGEVTVDANTITGVEVGIQVDGDSSPILSDNVVTGSTAAAFAVRGSATGRVVDNLAEPADGVGLLVEADGAPEVEGFEVRGGVLAVAYTGNGAGTLRGGRFHGQEIGVQLDDEAAPTIEDTTIEESEVAGIVARGSVAGSVSESQVIGAGEVAVSVSDDATIAFRRNVLDGGLSGASIVGQATPTLDDNRFVNLEVGLQVGEDAAPVIENNRFEAPTSAGMVFVGESSGRAADNVITDAGLVGVQLGDSAHPELLRNVIFAERPTTDAAAADGAGPDDAAAGDTDEGDEGDTADGDGDAADQAEEADEGADDGDTADGDGDAADRADGGEVAGATVGMLFGGASGGLAEGNQIVGVVIGLQVGEDATPELRANTVDGGVQGGVGFLFRDRAAGTATGNRTSSHAIGFQVSDAASPVLVGNTVVSVRDVAFLVQGEATPRLEGNECPDGPAGIGLLERSDPELIDNRCVEARGE